MAINLIKINEFPESVDTKNWMVVADTNGISYKISIDNVKAQLGLGALMQYGGAIVPTSPAPGAGDFFWNATQAGTYTNYNSIVVPANSFAVISRVGGVWSSSITELDTNTVLKTDIIDDLTTGGAEKVLSAEQGVVLNVKIAGVTKQIDEKLTPLSNEIGDIIPIPYTLPLSHRAYTATDVYSTNYSSVTQVDIGGSVDLGRGTGSGNIPVYFRIGKSISEIVTEINGRKESFLSVTAYIKSIVSGDCAFGFACLPETGAPFGYIYRTDGTIYKNENFSNTSGGFSVAPFTVDDKIRFEIRWDSELNQTLTVFKNDIIITVLPLPENLSGELCWVQRGVFVANSTKANIITPKVVDLSSYNSKIKEIDNSLSITVNKPELFQTTYNETGDNLLTEILDGYWLIGNPNLVTPSSAGHTNMFPIVPTEIFAIGGTYTPVQNIGRVFTEAGIFVGDLPSVNYPLIDGKYYITIPPEYTNAAKVSFNVRHSEWENVTIKRTISVYGKIKPSLIDMPNLNIPNFQGGTGLYKDLFTEISEEYENTNWALGDDGISPTATGLSNLIILRRDYAIKRRLTLRIRIGNDTNLLIFNRANQASGEVVSLGGSMFGLDAVNNRVVLYDGNNGTNSVRPIASTYPYTFNQDRDYIVNLDINPDLFNYTLTLIDGLTGIETEIFTDTANMKRWFDNFAFATLSGIEVVIKELIVSTPIKRGALAIVYGDSITAGATEPLQPGEGYAFKLIEAIGGGSCVSGRSGGETTGVIVRLKTEALFIKPKFIILTIGTNGTALALGQNLPVILDYVVNTLGAILIVNNVPMGHGDSVSKNAVITPFRQTNSLSGARLEIATALNYDPSQGNNPAFYITGDNTHPNALGHESMFLRFGLDVPELFY